MTIKELMGFKVSVVNIDGFSWLIFTSSIHESYDLVLHKNYSPVVKAFNGEYEIKTFKYADELVGFKHNFNGEIK